jgi:hypothetical protein
VAFEKEKEEEEVDWERGVNNEEEGREEGGKKK